MATKNKPSGEVFTSANAQVQADVVHHPGIVVKIRDPSTDLHAEGLVLVLPDEFAWLEVMASARGKRLAVGRFKAVANDPERRAMKRRGSD